MSISEINSLISRRMDANMEELEKKMGIKIEAVRDMMLDRFSGVDQKLTVIEELLKKIIETGNPPENMWNLTEKNMGEEGTEPDNNLDEGKKGAIGESGFKKVEMGGGDEFGPKEPLRAENDVDQEIDDQAQGPLGRLHFGDRGRYRPPWEAGRSCEWVGLYTHHYGSYNPHGSNYSFGKDLCGPAWVGLQETDFSKKNRPPFGSTHEVTFKGQLVNSLVKGCPGTTQIGTGPEVVNADVIEKGLNFGGHDDLFKDSDVLLQDSSKPDQRAKKDSGPFAKAIQNETNCELGSVESDKGLNWSTLVEAKTDPKHGVGPKPEGSNEGRPKTERRGWKVKKADVTGNKFQIGPKLQDFSKSNRLGTNDSRMGLTGKKVIKTVQENSYKSDQWGAKKSWTGSWNKWSKDSSKPDQRAKKDSGPLSKAMQTETSCESGCDIGLDWSKLVEAKTGSQYCWGLKRKHPEGLFGGPNDGPISSGTFTTSKRRVDMFSTDEQERVSEIEPIMQSIRRIMHQKGYNDGDPLSADDQTYILENVFNHHPDKAQKMGAGVDYIMVDKHMKFQGSRCFYVVSTDGRKQDFSYHKCLKNFISAKYRDKVNVTVGGSLSGTISKGGAHVFDSSFPWPDYVGSSKYNILEAQEKWLYKDPKGEH